jgi:hypothetical protein
MIAISNYRPKADRPLTIKSRHSQNTNAFSPPGADAVGASVIGN